MVADVYSHIIDEDRRLNAQRFEEEFLLRAGQYFAGCGAGCPDDSRPGKGCRWERRERSGIVAAAPAETGDSGNVENTGTGDVRKIERAGRLPCFFCVEKICMVICSRV